MEPTDPTEPPPPGPPELPRRSFIKQAVTIAIGGLVMVFPAAAGLMVFLDPLRRRGGAAGAGDVIPVAPLDAVPADGRPRKFQVVADRTDAWNRYLQVPIGAAYVRREGDRVTAFNAICPHAGCFVDARPDGTFLCPCHNSGFLADGSLAPNSVSPRGLDELEVDEAALKRGEVRIKFQNFQAGTHDKIPQS